MGSGASELVSNWEQNIICRKLEKGYLVYGRTYQRINFSTLNRFCQLSKTLSPPPSPPQFLIDIVKLDGIPGKIKWKYTPFLHCISSFEGISLNFFYNTVIMFFSSYCFTSADDIFHNFLEIHLTLSETIFTWMFLLLMDSLTPDFPTQTHTHIHTCTHALTHTPTHTHSSLSL